MLISPSSGNREVNFFPITRRLQDRNFEVFRVDCLVFWNDRLTHEPALRSRSALSTVLYSSVPRKDTISCREIAIQVGGWEVYLSIPRTRENRHLNNSSGFRRCLDVHIWSIRDVYPALRTVYSRFQNEASPETLSVSTLWESLSCR